MQSVTLNAWSSGFVATRLMKLLREYRFGLAESHRLASDFADGKRVSLLFAHEQDAARFVEAVRPLHVDAFACDAVTAQVG